MPYLGEVVTVRASAAATVTGQSAFFDVGNAEQLALLADVTAVTGTSPSMTLSVEWSWDGATAFASDPADQFAAIAAAMKRVKEFDIKAPYYRVVWTITGTSPSFTFSLRAYSN